MGDNGAILTTLLDALLVDNPWCRPTCPGKRLSACECGGMQREHERIYWERLAGGFRKPLPIIGTVPPLEDSLER